MKLIRSLAEIDESVRGGALAIGNFDGVHQGHAEIIKRLRVRADEVDGPAVVFTFDPHPVRLLRPEQAPPPLTWTNRKAQLLGELGVDALVAYPTDQALLELTPAEFFDRLVMQALRARAMVEGTNFYFGKDRAGTTETLQTLCAARDVELDIVPPLQLEGETVSSSRVRQCLREGQVEEAAQLLTRPYRLRGMVTHGARRGRQIGFPTANLEAIDTLVPKPGVYAGRALLRGQSHIAAINIGSNPTFGEDVLKVEVHLIDFTDTIYGEPLKVDFLARLRDIQAFAGPEALVAQLKQDVVAAKRIGHR